MLQLAGHVHHNLLVIIALLEFIVQIISFIKLTSRLQYHFNLKLVNEENNELSPRDHIMMLNIITFPIND